MLDSTSVITHAAHGIVKEIAADYEISLARAYEMLGAQCCYPKVRKLIRTIARHNQDGARLIKADLDTLFADVLDVAEEPALEDIHKEAYEAVDSVLRNKPLAVQKVEILELLDICQRKLEGIQRRLKQRRQA